MSHAQHKNLLFGHILDLKWTNWFLCVLLMHLSAFKSMHMLSKKWKWYINTNIHRCFWRVPPWSASQRPPERRLWSLLESKSVWLSTQCVRWSCKRNVKESLLCCYKASFTFREFLTSSNLFFIINLLNAAFCIMIWIFPFVFCLS